MSRRHARLAAVEILYAADVRNVPPGDVLSDRDDCDPYCAHLVATVDDRRHEIDGLLDAHAHRWPIERMSPVDRNVMRVGTLELLEGDVPPAAVIDEAVGMAKRFSGEEAGRFVNGVLEAVRQALGTGGAGGGSAGAGSAGAGSGGTPPAGANGDAREIL